MQRLLSKAKNQMASGNVRPEISVFLELASGNVRPEISVFLEL